MPEEKKPMSCVFLTRRRSPYTPPAYPYSGGPVDDPMWQPCLGNGARRAFKTPGNPGAPPGVIIFVVPYGGTGFEGRGQGSGEKSHEIVRLAELQPLTGLIPRQLLPGGHEKSSSRPSSTAKPQRAWADGVVAQGKSASRWSWPRRPWRD